ncbi:MAG: 3-keto-5-aminohexanoate cleavage protein [Proteobacteria bacterium]|nr:3-keto-5-aminohexanoate cleavage protein [Pseudomonadota bacterium]
MPTIISCAVTGSAPTPGKNSAVPVTPAQIAASAIDAAKAGAAIVHIHVRDPETTKPSMDPALYKETTERIRDSGTDVIINLTTGPGARYIPSAEDPGKASADSTMVKPELRVVHIEEMKPEICSLDVATMNFNQHVFLNHPDHLAIMAKRARAAGAKPELEVFDTGHIVLAKKMIADGLIDAPPYFQLCLGISYGAPATVESMMMMRDMLPDGAVWSAFGISREQFPMVAAGVLLGGNVRVGLEDNIWLEKGVMAPSNAALVEKAANIVIQLGGAVATVAEARKTLGLK